MAVVQNPIIGRARGKFGPAVFQTVFEKNILRTKPLIYRDPASPDQQLQRNKLQVACNFVSKNLIPFRTGFANASPYRSAYSSAISYCMQNSMVKNGNAWSIDPANVEFSQGNLMGFLYPEVESADSSGLRVWFENNSGNGNANTADIGHMIVFNSQMTQFYYVQTPNARTVQSMEIVFNHWQNTENAHVYIFATQSVGQLISNCQYMGAYLITV